MLSSYAIHHFSSNFNFLLEIRMKKIAQMALLFKKMKPNPEEIGNKPPQGLPANKKIPGVVERIIYACQG